mmetsp:Transcript_47316/g.94349  ORF Transcript_47316/g.94349 Transcript_47316/m.94349 type:complete len:209 (-) Transcript_47316:2254-2880(-)
MTYTRWSRLRFRDTTPHRLEYRRQHGRTALARTTFPAERRLLHAAPLSAAKRTYTRCCRFMSRAHPYARVSACAGGRLQQHSRARTRRTSPRLSFALSLGSARVRPSCRSLLRIPLCSLPSQHAPLTPHDHVRTSSHTSRRNRHHSSREGAVACSTVCARKRPQACLIIHMHTPRFLRHQPPCGGILKSLQRAVRAGVGRAVLEEKQG